MSVHDYIARLSGCALGGRHPGFCHLGPVHLRELNRAGAGMRAPVDEG